MENSSHTQLNADIALPMMARVQQFDWKNSALGPMNQWPAALRAIADMVLAHPWPMIVLWGPKLVQIYNDGYARIAGAKHPVALGQPTRECWPEVWHINGPIYQRVLESGESVLLEDQLFPICRHGVEEDAYFTLAYSPVHDGPQIAGVILSITETTAKVHAEVERERWRAEVDRREHLSELGQRVQVLETALTYINDFAYIFDREGRFLYVNRPLLDLWGISLDDAVGKDFFDLDYPGELATKLQRQVRQVFDTGERLIDETPYTSPTGVTGFYEYIFTPVVTIEGTVQLVTGSTREITARKQLEIEREQLVSDLKNQRARLAGIIEQAPAFMCTLLGPTHIIDTANEWFFATAGKRDLIGRTVHEALPEIKGQAFFIFLDQVFRTGEHYSAREMPVFFDRGEASELDQRYMNLAYLALRESDGSVSGVFVHGIDVTETVRARDELRQSEGRLQLALGIAQIGTFDINLLTDEVVVNDAGREVYGWQPDEPLTFTRVQAAFHPDDASRVAEQVKAALVPDGPGAFSIEQRIVRFDGQTRWIRVFGRTQFMEVDGEPHALRCVETYIDITNQINAEKQREALLAAERAARADAEEANESKNRFLAVLSHELRTPLTPVMLTVSMLESNASLSDEVRRDVSIIRRNVELESRLISDLLDLTRIENGKLDLDEQDVDLHLLVRSAIDICQREASTNMIVQLDANAFTVHGDSTRLQQVFWNLINNAIKFTAADGQITVRSSNPAKDTIRVDVIDDGVGIDEKTLPRLFNAFEQGEIRAARQQAGLGLGLSISKRLVEIHGGRIAVESAGRGQGSKFTVELSTVSSAHSPAAPFTPPASNAGPQLRVLLVEDHVMTLNVMARLMRKEGHQVTTAHSVATATAAANVETFDVMICDLGLPDGSGLDVMRHVRQRLGGRAIALTGYGMEDDIRASRDAGFAEHLIKPVDLSALQVAIRSVTAGKSSTF